MKIYIDLIFIQDTIVMTIILFIISKIIRIKIEIVRALIISAISSVISILILMYLPTLYDNLLVKFTFSFFLVKMVFRFKEGITTLQKVIVFWMITFLLGGINVFSKENMIQMPFLFGIMSIFIIMYRKKLKKQLFLDSATCFIEFENNGKSYHLKALLDTGHEVKTIYGEEVIFVRENLLEERGDEPRRLVSYKTIAGVESKIGLKIYHIKIKYGERKIYSNAVIVSTSNISRNFDAIVGYDLIEGGMMYGNINFNEAESQKAID